MAEPRLSVMAEPRLSKSAVPARTPGRLLHGRGWPHEREGSACPPSRAYSHNGLLLH